MEWNTVNRAPEPLSAEIVREDHTVKAYVWPYTNYIREPDSYLAFVEWVFKDGTRVHVRIPPRDDNYSREQAIAWATATCEDYPVVTFKTYRSESDIDRMLEGNER